MFLNDALSLANILTALAKEPSPTSEKKDCFKNWFLEIVFHDFFILFMTVQMFCVDRPSAVIAFYHQAFQNFMQGSVSC